MGGPPPFVHERCMRSARLSATRDIRAEDSREKGRRPSEGGSTERSRRPRAAFQVNCTASSRTHCPAAWLVSPFDVVLSDAEQISHDCAGADCPRSCHVGLVGIWDYLVSLSTLKSTLDDAEPRQFMFSLFFEAYPVVFIDQVSEIVVICHSVLS